MVTICKQHRVRRHCYVLLQHVTNGLQLVVQQSHINPGDGGGGGEDKCECDNNWKSVRGEAGRVRSEFQGGGGEKNDKVTTRRGDKCKVQ